MSSFVLRVLALTLGLFFVFSGTLKVTSSVNAEIYKEMRKAFIKKSKVFPFVKQTSWKPNPHMYRKAVGTVEIICGSLLAFVPGVLKEISNVLLLAIMLNDIYATYSLDEGLEKMALSIVFALLLACRIIIHLQDVAFLPSRANFSTTFVKICGRDEVLRTVTYLTPVVVALAAEPKSVFDKQKLDGAVTMDTSVEERKVK